MKLCRMTTLVIAVVSLSGQSALGTQGTRAATQASSSETTKSPAALRDMNAGPGNPCAADAKSFCKDVTPGEGRIAACLKAHEDKLSQGCRKEWQTVRNELRQRMKQEWKTARKACGQDVQKFCQDAAGPREVRDCLKSHTDDLSSSCKNYQANLSERMNRNKG